MTESPCPVECGRKQPAGMLMCPACWRSVPVPLRRDVLCAWRAVQTMPRGYTKAQREQIGKIRIAEYRSARDAAIAAARERLIKKEIKA